MGKESLKKKYNGAFPAKECTCGQIQAHKEELDMVQDIPRKKSEGSWSTIIKWWKAMSAVARSLKDFRGMCYGDYTDTEDTIFM